MVEHEVYTATHAARMIAGFLWSLVHSLDCLFFSVGAISVDAYEKGLS